MGGNFDGKKLFDTLFSQLLGGNKSRDITLEEVMVN